MNVVQRHDQQAADQAADGGQQQRLDKETGKNTASRETENAQCTDFAGSAGDARVHRIHGGETTAYRHDDGDEGSDELDWSSGDHLFRVILLLGDGIDVDSLVRAKIVDKALNCSTVDCTDQHRTEYLTSVVIGCSLVEVHP